MKAWYLVYSKPRQERVALDNLSRQNYQAFLPMIRLRRKRQGRYAWVTEAMFPRYLFIKLSDKTDNWGPIRSTIGVAGLVRFGGRPAKVPADLVSALETNEAGIWELPAPDLKAGDRVRICEGPMAGYEGIFQNRSGKERVTLLLDVVSQAARVEVALDQIEPAQ
jgi:transcriptional antiterminator RfaH